MKIKHFLFGGILALTTALGAFVGVRSFDKQSKQVEEVSAGASHTVYYATKTQRNNYYADVKYNNGEGDSDWRGSHFFSEVGRSGDYYIYSASVWEEYGDWRGLWIRYGSGGTGGTWVDTVIDWQDATSYTAYENKVFINGSAAKTFKSIYTITYNPNGATGSTKTEYKINGISYTILSYSNAGISSHVYKHAVKWGTNESGTGTSYQPGAIYTTNANLSLYFIEDWYSYQFAVNGGDWNNLTKTEDTPEGYVAKFTAIYSFTAGDVVTFRKYYGTETPISITPSSYEENIGSTGAIYYSADNTYIDLKLTSGNGHTIKVGGFAERGISIERGGHSYKCAATYDSSKNQFVVYGITVLVGDTIKATYQGQTPYEIYVENIDVYGVSRDGVVNTPGVFDIYLKLNEFSQFNNVYLSMNDSATAKLIAQTFNTALTAVCNSTVSGGSTSQITSAFETQSGYYNHLTANCKALLSSDTTSDADILAMRAKYDFLVGKYGTEIAPDYLSRNPAKIGRSTFSPIVLLADNNNSTVVIIIVSTLVAVSAVGGYFLLRKRKEQ